MLIASATRAQLQISSYLCRQLPHYECVFVTVQHWKTAELRAWGRPYLKCVCLLLIAFWMPNGKS